MVILFSILFCIFLYLLIQAFDEISTNKKFKAGYFLDIYELKFHTDNSYKKVATYKIEASGNGYVIVQDRTDGKHGEFNEFKITDLLYTKDKIIIKNENGEEVETFFKPNSCAY